MRSPRFALAILLLATVSLAACKRSAQGSSEPYVAPSKPEAIPAQPAAPASPAQNPAQPLAQPITVQAAVSQLEDSEERLGPFAISGQNFTAVLRYKRIPGKTGPDSKTVTSLEIVNAAGEIQHQESFPHTIEKGEFAETCSVGIQMLTGSNGKGLLVDTGCLPSAPLSGGPWQIFGVLNGKLAPIGNPVVTEGELGEFVPGAINKIGTVTQIRPDVMNFRVWTGYFFVTVPVRVNWMQGKLALGQRCYFQTGNGFAEGGCDMRVEDAKSTPREQDLTFVRLFAESNEQIGTPAHVVVKKDSKVEILSANVLVIMKEGPEVFSLEVGDDVWVKVRIDGKEGWIHTPEDLNAIGLYQSG